MNEVRYIISDAAKKVSVEPHVLRYWEEELDLKIPRNEMGHRYYREKDIEMLKLVKQLKDKGFQLKAIKMEVEALENAPSFSVANYEVEETAPIEIEEETQVKTDIDREDRMAQFRMIMSDIIGQALRENNHDLSSSVTSTVSETLVKEMDYLVREKEEKEEARYQRLDELIREIQRTRAEAAAAKMELEKAEKRKRGLFRK